MALITAVFVIVALMGLAFLVMTLSIRTQEGTVTDRLRENAFQAADAGIDSAVQCLSAADPDDFAGGVAACRSQVSAFTGSTTLTAQGRDVGQFHVEIDDETPAGAEIRTILLRSWGVAPALDGRATRHVTTRINLIPVGGFFETLFASGDGPGGGMVSLRNNATVNGSTYALSAEVHQNGNRGQDVQVRGNFETKNQDTFRNIHAGGNVTIGNSTITGNVQACGAGGSAGNLSLHTQGQIQQTATYKGSFTGPQGNVGNLVRIPDGCEPPPDLDLPAYSFNPAAYPSPGWTVITFDSASLANTCLQLRAAAACNGQTLGPAANQIGRPDTAQDNTAGTLVRVTDSTCLSPVRLTHDVGVTGNFTLLSEHCRVEVGGSYTVPAGDPNQNLRRQLVIISNRTSGIGIDVNNRFTTAPVIDTLLYTRAKVEVKNNTEIGSGAIYAAQIETLNNLVITQSGGLTDNTPPNFIFPGQAERFIPVKILWQERGAPPLPTPGP